MIFKSKTDFYQNGNSFLNQLYKKLCELKINLEPHWWADHICYRSATDENYMELKKFLNSIGSLLAESSVNGRMIATYKLVEPFYMNDEPIDILELPAPKPHQSIKEGFEHIEVVCDVSFNTLTNLYAHVTQDLSGLRKNLNQEFELNLSPNMNIKFHHISLESILRLEQNYKVFNALKNSKILDVFKPYNPLVAGTFPLDIHKSNSDLDILLGFTNKNEFLESIQSFPLIDFPNIKNEITDGMDTYYFNFIFEEISFEVFAQPIEPVYQRAYRHFLAEERLLKIGEPELKNKILNLRSMGFKTEPAFAKVLSLSGDPYHALLDLQKMSRKKLISLL